MGFGELLVVLVIALIFLGPEKIPSTARTLGRWFHEIKSTVDGLQQAFEKDMTETVKKDQAGFKELPKNPPAPESTPPPPPSSPVS
ncbi:MAG: Sec-independent protein translocase protein TatB [bacterium]